MRFERGWPSIVKAWLIRGAFAGYDGAAFTQPGQDTSWCVESAKGKPSLETLRSISAYMC